MNMGATGFNTFRITQFESPIGMIANMTSHVSQGASAEVPPTSPIKRDIICPVITIWSRTYPKIPIESLGNGLFAFRSLRHSLRPI